MTKLCTTKEVFIQAPPETVWRVHTAIDAWARWQPGVRSAKLSGPPAVGAAFNWKAGGLALRSTIRSLQANREISWAGEALGTRAHHSWTLRAHDGGTVVTTEESMSGWLVSLLKVASPRFLDRSLEVWLQALKARAEGARDAARAAS